MADPGSEQAVAEPTEPEPLVGQVLAERYRVEALLGEGGMGAVYRARHVHMHKTVALKVLHREMTQFPEAVARFEREAVAGARIEHANVAAATDFGRLDDGSFYLVLEYVEGRSLRSEIDKNGALPPARCVRIARQIASALSAAHNLGIVHRDLKPENIMLANRPDEPDFVKVLDFGIAKVNVDAGSGPALTRLGAVFGTPEYMSPEQALGKTVDHRSDLYSLGVMLYEMTAGHRPFDADQAVTVLAAQIGKAPPPLPEHVHPLLASLIRTLLNKAPDERLQSGAEVMRALEEMAISSGLLTSLPLGPGSSPSISGTAVVSSSGWGSSSAIQSSPSIQVGGLSSVGIGTDILGNPSQPSIAITGLSAGPGEGPVSGVNPTALAVGPVPSGASAPRREHPSLERAVSFARGLWARAEPELRRPVRLGSASVPAGVIALVPVPLLVVLIALIWMVAAWTRPSPKPAALVFGQLSGAFGVVPPPAVQAGFQARVVTAEQVRRIEAVPVYKRKLEDWLDLGRGYTLMKKPKDAALAYRAALQLDKAPRNDPEMLFDLREIAAYPEGYSLVVNVCEGGGRGLGDAGFELLWDLWMDFKARPDQIGPAESTFKKLVVLSRRVSPALRVAVELNAASSCDPVPEILERTIKYGDQRAVPRLREMEQTSGCGVDKRDDCWQCLRGSDALVSARKLAEGRAAPKIERGYR